MKIAISIPDRLFYEADGLAKELKISRSALYADAIDEYLARRDAQRITTQLDAVYREPRTESGQLLHRQPVSRQDAW